MPDPIWMDLEDALVVHDLQLATHGGGSGVRDSGLLESALGRPRNVWAYSQTTVTLPRLAAAYAFGISSNYPFVDGNKRTALVVSFTFLEVNGFEVTASQEDAYGVILALASGDMTEDALAEWFSLNSAAL